MVVVEGLAAQGALVGALKLAGSSGSTAAATLFLPTQPSDLAVLHPAFLQHGLGVIRQAGVLQGMHALWHGLCSVAAPVATVGATCGIWAIYHRDFDESDQDCPAATARGGINAYVPSILGLIALNDSYMAGVLIQSIGLPIQSHLRLWAAGSILLSFPVSQLVSLVNQRKPNNVREAFAIEAFFTAASFAWLVWGSVMLGDYPMDAQSAPLLFYSCFTQASLTWSLMSTGLVVIVVLTVISHLGGTK